MPEFLEKAFQPQPASSPELVELVLRVTLATLFGALVAFRPWRRLLRGARPPSLQGAQSQTLIAAAGALMVMVIGESVARAFGLVGLGSFIRFRSGISDPRDAAILFVMIGVGMACGLGLGMMAAAGTLLVCLILIVFDLTGRKRSLVTLLAEDPQALFVELTRFYRGARAVEISNGRAEPGKEAGRLIVELDLEPSTDASSLRAELERRGVTGISRVSIAE
jgi:uncharacterized membrane protein YhiD involved in acid resistance